MNSKNVNSRLDRSVDPSELTREEAERKLLERLKEHEMTRDILDERIREWEVRIRREGTRIRAGVTRPPRFR